MARSSAYKDHGTPTYTTAGTPREIEILKLLARYDLLPSSFIYHALGKRQSIRDYLLALRQGHYIGLPDLPRDEKLAYIPRNSHYVYELKPRGRALLAKHGRVTIQGGNDHYKHRLLRSEIEYLLDRAPLSVKGPADILSHRACPKATRDAPYPFRIPLKPSLEPDITRGFGNGENYIFLHIEVDRGTEPLISANTRQSIKSKVERYVEYMNGYYERHFGFVVPPSVLFITTRQNTDQLLEALKEFSGKKAKRFYVTTIPEKPLPTTNLFVPWQGIDGTLDLMEKFSHVRREESGASERTSASY
jgi:hypothetical protein